MGFLCTIPHCLTYLLYCYRHRTVVIPQINWVCLEFYNSGGWLLQCYCFPHQHDWLLFDFQHSPPATLPSRSLPDLRHGYHHLFYCTMGRHHILKIFPLTCLWGEHSFVQAFIHSFSTYHVPGNMLTARNTKTKAKQPLSSSSLLLSILLKEVAHMQMNKYKI